MQISTSHYRIAAEMDDQAGVPPGTIKWLGMDQHPHWTDEPHAIEFATTHGIRQFYQNGGGYRLGLYRPKAGTVVVIERTINTTITLRSSPLDAD